MRWNGPRFTYRVCLLAELVHSCVREPRATAFHSGGVVASAELFDLSNIIRT